MFDALRMILLLAFAFYRTQAGPSNAVRLCLCLCVLFAYIKLIELRRAFLWPATIFERTLRTLVVCMMSSFVRRDRKLKLQLLSDCTRRLPIDDPSCRSS